MIVTCLDTTLELPFRISIYYIEIIMFTLIGNDGLEPSPWVDRDFKTLGWIVALPILPRGLWGLSVDFGTPQLNYRMIWIRSLWD